MEQSDALKHLCSETHIRRKQRFASASTVHPHQSFLMHAPPGGRQQFPQSLDALPPAGWGSLEAGLAAAPLPVRKRLFPAGSAKPNSTKIEKKKRTNWKDVAGKEFQTLEEAEDDLKASHPSFRSRHTDHRFKGCQCKISKDNHGRCLARVILPTDQRPWT